MCQVQSLQGAEEAVSAGADVLVAQGNEAGGHTGGMNSLPLLVHLLNRYPNFRCWPRAASPTDAAWLRC